MTRLEVVEGDITRLQVDAIVNAANETLLGGGGVDGAIHQAAGSQLLHACRKLGGCPTGAAKATPGFDLQAKHVFHAVGPRWKGGDQGEVDLLGSAYRTCLDLADQHACTSIAFPCISTGAFGYPFEQASKVALQTVRSWLDAHPNTRLERVVFCCFGATDAEGYRRAVVV